MSEIQQIKSFFDSHQVILSPEWLESCIEWCKTEGLGHNWTIKDLQFKVYEQWLLLDLRDVELAALPPNISDQKKYTLTGSYSLQIMQIIDISKPKMWQLQKIRNNHALTRNLESDNQEVGSGKRVLLLTLTDGVQEIEAMEYKPIKSLNINSKPGMKLRITGPISVRRGRLMLEEHHVKILGGEVEEILVTNAAENILARALGVEENPNPFVIAENMLSTNNDITTHGNRENNPPSRRNQSTTILNPVPIQRNIQSNNMNLNSNKPQIKNDYPSEKELEEMELDAEIDMLMETEREMTTTHTKVQTPDMFDDDFEDINEEEILRNVRMETNPSKSTVSHKPECTSVVKSSLENDLYELNDLCDDVFSDFNLDATINSPDEFISIKRLNEINREKKTGIYKVKAKFKAIVEKLTVNEHELLLVIKIEDPTGDFVVKVNSEIITGFAGYTPAAFMNLKGNIQNKDQSATLKVIKALKEIKENLMKLDSGMEIKLEQNGNQACLVKLL